MAQTWSYTEDFGSGRVNYGYFQTEAVSKTVSASGSTFTLTTPNFRTWLYAITWDEYYAPIPPFPVQSSIDYWFNSDRGSVTLTNPGNNVSTDWANVSKTYNTSSYFNSSNKTTKSVNIPFYVGSMLALFKNGARVDQYYINSPGIDIQPCTFTVTLNAPPVFNTTPTISKNTDGYYKDVTAISVESSSYAQYGGDLTSTKLTIGSQTTSINGNGTLSIKLNTVGTFTPTLTVTDSRGQTTTHTFNEITVVDGTPTTFSYTQPASNKNGFWTEKATASITLGNLTVPYSGTATAKFTIGNQSVSRSNNGTLTITPNSAGTFTPTLTVTDSFGRVYNENLNSITINQYVAPNISYKVYRAKNVTEGGITKYGIKDEESTTNILIESTITYIKNVGNLLEPTVTIDNIVTSNIVWYESYDETNGLTNEIDWTEYNPNSPINLYALVDGTFAVANSFVLGIIAHDSVGGNSIEISQTLPPAFFTIDFLAGGHGVSFGQIATQEGFYCAMDANFKDFSGVMRSMFNIFYPKGSYYETHLTNAIPSGSTVPTAADLVALGDTWFDPNYAWGGTWTLEVAGQVHVSAGTGYAVSGALTNVSDGGESTHILTPGETAMKDHSHTINHGHGFTQPTVNEGSHTHTYEAYTNRAIYAYHSDGNARFQSYTASTGYDGGHTHSVSGGAVTDHAGSSGGQTAANGSAHNNMQPYINVYRWHRTA